MRYSRTLAELSALLGRRVFQALLLTEFVHILVVTAVLKRYVFGRKFGLGHAYRTSNYERGPTAGGVRVADVQGIGVDGVRWELGVGREAGVADDLDVGAVDKGLLRSASHGTFAILTPTPCVACEEVKNVPENAAITCEQFMPT